MSTLSVQLKLNNMAIMSYCRFENTANDLRDCVYALNESEENHKQGGLL